MSIIAEDPPFLQKIHLIL